MTDYDIVEKFGLDALADQYLIDGYRLADQNRDVRVGVAEYRVADQAFVDEFNAAQDERVYTGSATGVDGEVVAYPGGFDSGGAWFTALWYTEA